MKIQHNSRVLILLDQAVFSGTSFVLTIAVARMLSMENFGVYSGLILGVYLLVSAINAFTIQPFQVLFAQQTNKKLYVSSVFMLQSIFILLAFVLVLLLNQTIPGFHYPYFALYVAGFLFHDFGRKLLLTYNKLMQTLIFDTLSAIFGLVLLVLYYFQQIDNLNALFGLLSLAYLPPMLYFMAVIRPFIFEKTTFKTVFKQHFKQGKWLFLTALSQWWSGNLFVVASGVYLGATALAALRLGQSLFGVLNIVLQTFENYVLPQTAQKYHANPEDGLLFLGAMNRKASLVFLPILMLIFIFSTQIMSLAGGADYRRYGYVIQGLAVLYLLILLSQPIRMMIRTMLLNKQFFYGYLLTLVFALFSSKFLMTQFDLIGILIGLGLSQLILIIYWTHVLHKQNIRLWKSYILF